jgi:hypothetical protein
MLKDVGEAVAPNETIVRVVNLDRLRVVSRIDQAVIGSVKIGDEIIFLPIRQNAEVDSISAVITFISPEFIAEEGVVEIWAEFDNRESRMFAGEAGEIEIPSLRNK